MAPNPKAKVIQFPPLDKAEKTKLMNLINMMNTYMDGDMDVEEIKIVQVTTERPDIAAVLEKVAQNDKKKPKTRRGIISTGKVEYTEPQDTA